MLHIDAVWARLLAQALDSPKADAKQDSIREIVGCHVVLDGSAEQFLHNPRRKLSAIYASAELLWYLRRDKSAEMIRAYAPSYTEFCDDGIHAHGAYGDRLANNLATTTDGLVEQDLLEAVIVLLKKRPTTKKAVVLLWRPEDLLRSWDNDHAKESRDVPCTVSWQFLARGERLHMICSMRSQDLWKGFLYDAYVNTVIQRYVAAALGLTAGEYHMVAGSEHLYERDVKKAEEAVHSFHVMNASDTTRPESWYPANNYWTDDELKATLGLEKYLRTKVDGDGRRNAVVIPRVLSDALNCCGMKWQPSEHRLECIRSPSLRKAMERLNG